MGELNRDIVDKAKTEVENDRDKEFKGREIKKSLGCKGR